MEVLARLDSVFVASPLLREISGGVSNARCLGLMLRLPMTPCLGNPLGKQQPHVNACQLCPAAQAHDMGA